MHTEAIRHQRLYRLRIVHGREVDRMAMLPEGHKHAAMRRILLHHFKAEQIGVECLGALHISNF
jgi:hypothetical protein